MIQVTEFMLKSVSKRTLVHMYTKRRAALVAVYGLDRVDNGPPLTDDERKDACEAMGLDYWW